ncbi:MAG TPA: hypothetical protein DDZ88_25350 [Verrucomicrobiales bacterium]|nr:hypothetical protein [Verrucomicrobiales bacterium]
MNTALIPIEHTATYFADRIRAVGDEVLNVAADLVAALDARPELRAELIDAKVSRDVIDNLERLGRGEIHRNLVLDSSTVGRRLLKLPLSVQTQAIEAGVEVLDPDEQTTRLIPVDELTPKQVEQVFPKHGHQRSLAEQRTWLRERKSKQPVPVSPAYRVCKDCIITPAGERITKAQILQWLAEMH